MDIHKNARLSFRSRELLVHYVAEPAVSLSKAAAAFHVTGLVPHICPPLADVGP